MTAAQPWVLFCDHEMTFGSTRPCPNVWTAARRLDGQWHARLLASAAGWTSREHDPVALLEARDYCPEHAENPA